MSPVTRGRFSAWAHQPRGTRARVRYGTETDRGRGHIRGQEATRPVPLRPTQPLLWQPLLLASPLSPPTTEANEVQEWDAKVEHSSRAQLLLPPADRVVVGSYRRCASSLCGDSERDAFEK